MRTSTRVDNLNLRVQQLSTRMEAMEDRYYDPPDPHDLHMRVVRMEGEFNVAKDLLVEHLAIHEGEMQEGRDADHEYRALRPEYV